MLTDGLQWSASGVHGTRLAVREAGRERAVQLGRLMGFPSWACALGMEGVEWAAGLGEGGRPSEGAGVGLRPEMREGGLSFSSLFSKPFSNPFQKHLQSV